MATLANRDKEVQGRTDKTLREKSNLEDQTSDMNNKIITEKTYNKIAKEAVEIMNHLEQRKTKDNNISYPPLAMLLEIEQKVEYAIAELRDQ